jgi:ElaB/YqjD/DUF883 family membrane-anchored ribosome-binding protein
MASTSRARRALHAVEDTAASTSDRIATMAGEVKDNIAEAGEAVTRTAQDAVGSVSQRMRDVGVDPDRLADTAKAQMSKLQEAVEDELRERPLRTLAIAAAVGLVAGLMTTR